MGQPFSYATAQEAGRPSASAKTQPCSSFETCRHAAPRYWNCSARRRNGLRLAGVWCGDGGQQGLLVGEGVGLAIVEQTTPGAQADEGCHNYWNRKHR